MSAARVAVKHSDSKARYASARTFAALGDPMRLTLVSRLCAGGPSSIRDLTIGTGITRQAVTKHLQSLEVAGLARAQRSGREQHWQLRPESLDQTRRYLNEISDQWDQALQRLRALVEGSTD